MKVAVKPLYLRGWQQEFVKLVQCEDRKVYGICACPGAGKTVGCLAVVQSMHAPVANPKLIVVSPSCEIRDNWAKVALKQFGLNLLYTHWERVGGRRRLVKWDGSLRPFEGDMGYDGISLTYAQLARDAGAPGSWSECVRGLCRKFNTAAIADEIHHASSVAAWGSALELALGSDASLILLASGPPFRTDGRRISYANYTAGGAFEADISYTYGQAIADRICRPITFHKLGGQQEWIGDDQVHTASFEDPLEARGVSRRLRTSVSTASTLLSAMITEANDELDRMRLAMPDAAGLLVAQDQDHARRITSLVRDLTGDDAALAISDGDEDSRVGADVIDAFRDGSKKWLVAVGMVSEGVDIPRLRVLVYATNITSPLRFRQITGRVVRTRSGEAFGRSHVWIPNDSRLVELAVEIEKEVEAALREPPATREESEDREDREPAQFTPLGGEGDDRGRIDRGCDFSAHEIEQAAFVSAKSGLHFDPVSVAKAVRALDEFKSKSATPEPKQVIDLSKELTKKRDRLSKMVGRYAYGFGDEVEQPHKLAWKLLKASSRIKTKPSNATMAELDRMLEAAESLLRDPRPKASK
jgi:superfamily II DNA or RNA helicase